jgi:hypothetical protein
MDYLLTGYNGLLTDWVYWTTGRLADWLTGYNGLLTDWI